MTAAVDVRGAQEVRAGRAGRAEAAECAEADCSNAVCVGAWVREWRERVKWEVQSRRAKQQERRQERRTMEQEDEEEEEEEEGRSSSPWVRVPCAVVPLCRDAILGAVGGRCRGTVRYERVL